MSPTKQQSAVPSDLARSWLLVSGRDPALFDEAADGAADEVILDVEDAVDPSHKDDARQDVARWLTSRKDVSQLIDLPGVTPSAADGIRTPRKRGEEIQDAGSACRACDGGPAVGRMRGRPFQE